VREWSFATSLADEEGGSDRETVRQTFHRSGSFACEDMPALARPAGAFRPLEVCLQPVLELDEERALGGDVPCAAGRSLQPDRTANLEPRSALRSIPLSSLAPARASLLIRHVAPNYTGDRMR